MCKIVPRYPHDSSESWLRNSLLVSRDVVILWQFRLTRLTVKLDLRYKTFKFLNTYFLASSSSSSSACSRERTFGSRLRPRVRSLGVWPRVRCGDGDRRRWTTPTEDDRLRGKVRKRSGVEFWSQKFRFKRVLRRLQYYNCGLKLIVLQFTAVVLTWITITLWNGLITKNLTLQQYLQIFKKIQFRKSRFQILKLKSFFSSIHFRNYLNVSLRIFSSFF